MGWAVGKARSQDERQRIGRGLRAAYADGRRKRGMTDAGKAKIAAANRRRFESGWVSPTQKYSVGDKFIDKKYGYVMVVPEHRMVAEKALGRKLKRTEVVHHINGDKTDNRNDNLLVCSHKYHAELHGRMSYLYQRQNFGAQ